MKPVSFVIIAVLLGVILFSIFQYASKTPIFENMSQGRYMIVSAIINDDSPTTSNLEKITAIKGLNISDTKITDILKSDITNAAKIEGIQKAISSVTL
jgi:hypothetical protein